MVISNMAGLINRAALVVKPRKPYLDWAASLDVEVPKHAEGRAERVSIYLVAEDPKGREETAPIRDYYEDIFEAELDAWWTNEEQWPEPRTLKLFLEWFEVVGESVVTDLESGPIIMEE